MSEIFDWNTKCAGKTEISEFKDAFTVNEQVLGFKVSVEDLVLVTLGNTV